MNPPTPEDVARYTALRHKLARCMGALKHMGENAIVCDRHEEHLLIIARGNTAELLEGVLNSAGHGTASSEGRDV